jgi:stress-induced morphogen
MPITKQALQEKIQKTLEPTVLELTDTSDGCGQSFEVMIVSNVFQEKTSLQRHRMVHSLLQQELKEIHAFSQQTFTPLEWSNKQSL